MKRSTRDLLHDLIGGASLSLPEEQTLATLLPMQVSDLVATYGMSDEQARLLRTSLDLAGCIATEPVRWRGKVFKDGADVFRAFGEKVRHLQIEQFRGILLDGKHRMIREWLISQGTLTSSPVHPREVFEPAVRFKAAGIVVYHNHPSGTADPSADDLDITYRLSTAGELIGIRLVDSIILGDGCYVSLADRGILRR